jgi:hypothetical protein
VRAQEREKIRRIGVLLPAAADHPDYQAWFGAFLQELAHTAPHLDDVVEWSQH